jgi:hypothetical protein
MKRYALLAVSTLAAILPSSFSHGQDEKSQPMDHDAIYAAKMFSVGHRMRPMMATTRDGKQISIPRDYHRKIVFLDVWHAQGDRDAFYSRLDKVYQKYRGKGLVVVHLNMVSQDVQATLDKDSAYWYPANGYSWMPACDCNEMGMYKTTAMTPFMPQALVIDGDTGEILANDELLWGSGLERAVEISMTSKFGPQVGRDGPVWSGNSMGSQ